MAMLCYTGTPGSGKTLCATLQVYESLYQGKNVIANYRINEDIIKVKMGRRKGLASQSKKKKVYRHRRTRVHKMSNSQRRHRFNYCSMKDLSIDFLKEYARRYHRKGKESQTLVVIDEASIFFNTRDWNRAKADNNNRHNKPKEKVDSRMDWIEFFCQHRKWGYDFIFVTQFFKSIDRQIRELFEYETKFRKLNNFGIIGVILSLFRISLFVRVNIWVAIREKSGATFFTYKPRYGKMYDTYNTF